MNFAAESYGWTYDEIVDSSLVFLLLLMNEHVRKASGGKGLSLLDMEQLDETKDVPWDELVRRNREQLVRSGVLSQG